MNKIGPVTVVVAGFFLLAKILERLAVQTKKTSSPICWRAVYVVTR